MKKFSVPCDFNGVKSPFTIYIGSARQDHHPLHFQSDWLSKDRGGTIPQEIMDSLTKLRDLAKKNGVKFEDLCVYALGAAQQEAEQAADETNEGDSADQNSDEDTKLEPTSDQPSEELASDQTDEQDLDQLLDTQDDSAETDSETTETPDEETSKDGEAVEELDKEVTPAEEKQPEKMQQPTEEKQPEKMQQPTEEPQEPAKDKKSSDSNNQSSAT